MRPFLPLAALLLSCVNAMLGFGQNYQNESIQFHGVEDDVYTGFGKSVAISDDWMMISDWAKSGAFNDITGAVEVYRRTSSGWRWHQEIRSTEPGHGFQFGSTIALEGNTLVVGAPTWGWYVDRPDDPYFASGKAFVYELQGSNWNPVIALRPTIQDAWLGGFNGVKFGTSVAIDGDRIAVGCPGTFAIAESGRGSGVVYTYKRVAGMWAVDQPIVSPACPLVGLPICSPFHWDSFGLNLALEGDRLAISAPSGWEGMVSTWVASPSGWLSESFIPSPIPGSGLTERRHFGSRVSMDGNRMAIGLTSSDCFTPPCQSLVAIYELRGTDWTRVQILSEINGEPGGANARFGTDIKLKGDTLFASAIGMRQGSQSVAQIRRYDYNPSQGFQLSAKLRHRNLPTVSPNSTLGLSFDVNFEQGWIIAGDKDYAYPSSTTTNGWAAGAALFFDLELGQELSCQGSGNTSGYASHLAVTGGLTVGENRLSLHATHLPPGQMAIFLYGLPQQAWPIHSGGELCLGGIIQRLSPPGLVGPLGERFLDLDLTVPREAANLLPGTTWGFQLWHRDQIPGWSFTGTTNAVEVLLR